MTDQKKPEDLDDTGLDAAQGGSVFGTPSGGWGVWKAPAGTEADIKDREGGVRFSTGAGGDPNI